MFINEQMRDESKLWRLFKFALSALILYFVFKTPIMVVLTEVFRIHYVLSGALAGAVITILQFIPSEWWVWKRASLKED